MIPLTIAVPVITSLLGGVGNALFGSDREEVTKQTLIDKYGYKPLDEGKLKGDLARLVSAQLKNRRSGIQARNSQMGIKDASAVYSNEEDVLNNQIQGEANIENSVKQEENNIAKLLMQINSGQPPEKGWGQNFFEGALAGANIGTSFAKLIPDGGASPSATPPTTDNGIDTALKGFTGLGDAVKTAKETTKGISSIIPQDSPSEEDTQFENLLNQGWSVAELEGMGYKLPAKYKKKNVSFFNDEINN